jgi:adenosylcobyric acid synthase
MVLGTYLHGLFHNDDFRQVFLNNLRKHWGLPETRSDATSSKDRQYDKLADLIRRSLDMPQIYRIMEACI